MLGESFEFLVVGELLAHLRNKLRTNKLGGALAEMGVTELVEGAMFLRSSEILVGEIRVSSGKRVHGHPHEESKLSKDALSNRLLPSVPPLG